jgi:signal transduction histidine kinase
MNPDYHKMLVRQIHKTLGDSPVLSPELQALLQRVSDSYTQADEDHALIERSLELSSKELSAINKSIEGKVRQRTEELRQEHTRFVSSINGLGVGFIMCDTTNRIAMINPAMQHILAADASLPVSNQPKRPVRADWTLDEIDGLLQPDFQLKGALAESLKTGQKTEFKNVVLGPQILHLFLAPIVSTEEDGNSQTLGVVILVEDITEQKVLERSKDEFFSIASHELRTPLTAIQGNADIIRNYYADKLNDPELSGIVGDIHESAVRLIGIVNDFLDVSALEQGKMRLEPAAFQFQGMVDAVARDLQSICTAKNLALTVDPSIGSMPPVIADETRIKQVVYNLVGNATKFTEKGGITIAAHADDKLVYISVADTGRGMSIEDQRLLFHKFQQAGSSLLTRDTPKGTGLGLYISKLIVERSGGTIGLDHSEVGKGSTFVFSLPRADAIQGSSPENTAPSMQQNNG